MSNITPVKYSFSCNELFSILENPDIIIPIKTPMC